MANKFKKAVEAIPDIKDGFRFGVQALGGMSYLVTSSTPRLFDGSVDIDACTKDLYPIDPETMLIRDNIGASHTFYFTGEGNRDIYYFDTSNAFVRKIYTSDTEITAFRQGEVGNGAMMPGLYEDLFVIGDGNGKITVLDMANVPGTNAEVVDEVQTDAGGITCMEFLPNNAYML